MFDNFKFNLIYNQNLKSNVYSKYDCRCEVLHFLLHVIKYFVKVITIDKMFIFLISSSAITCNSLINYYWIKFIVYAKSEFTNSNLNWVWNNKNISKVLSHLVEWHSTDEDLVEWHSTEQ